MKPHKPLQFIKDKLIFLPASGKTLAYKKVGKFICPFQEKIITTAYDHNGDVKNSIFLGWSRKISKSMLLSWFYNYCLESKEGWQGVVMASTFGQSGNIWDLIRGQIESNPEICEGDYSLTREKIKNNITDSCIYRVFNKASSNLGMVAIQSAIADQIESMPTIDNINAVFTGMLMQEGKPHFLLASNPPIHISHWSIDWLKAKKEDKRFKFFDFSAPLSMDYESVDARVKANPFYALYKKSPKKYKHLKGVVSNIDAEFESAKKSDVVTFRKYFLGQRISSKSYEWVKSQDLKVMPLQEVLERNTRVVAGFDLSLVRDICSCVLCFFDETEGKIFMKPFFHVSNIREKSKKQQSQFLTWHNQGHITIQDLPAIDRDIFLNEIKDFISTHNIRLAKHVWDRGLVSTLWTDCLAKEPELVRGTPYHMTAGIRHIEAKAREGSLYMTEDNPCFRVMFDSCIVSAKSKGYCSLDRASDKHFIDGCISAVLATKWILENKKKQFMILSG